LFSVPVAGGPATALPLPTANAGQYSPDGKAIAYAPLASAFAFDPHFFAAWGNYRGGRAGVVRITTLPGLDTTEIPHTAESDFSPVWVGDKIYYLSARGAGAIGVWSYDPATKAVAEVYRNPGADIRSLATDGESLIFDRLGELYLLSPGGQPTRLDITAAGDMPEVRARIENVGAQIANVSVSPTGVRVAVEAHGEILTVPAKPGAMRNLTNSPGAMEREPSWSPDGQSVAYFSDAGGLYALHVASQKGAEDTGPSAVKTYKLSDEPAYYYKPVWSPDSRKITFYDNRLNRFLLDVATGRVSPVGEPDVYGGFVRTQRAVAWSPDSKWLVYPRMGANHLNSLMLYSTATGSVKQLTDGMADAYDPAFDRNGKHLYFLASNNGSGAATPIDMTTDVYRPLAQVYAIALTRETQSPTAPVTDDEKTEAQAAAKAKDATDKTPAGKKGKGAPVDAGTAIDLGGLSLDDISVRTSVLPLPPKPYRSLQAGKAGSIYVLAGDDAGGLEGPGGPATLMRWAVESPAPTPLSEGVTGYQVTADGEKLLVSFPGVPGPDSSEANPPKPTYVVVAADAPLKPEDKAAAINTAGLEVRVDPAAEWTQMYREVWRVQRAFFYDPGFHGVDTVGDEQKLARYLPGIQSRADLNYLFQEMLSSFSVGHMFGGGGEMPSARKVPGGMLGADYRVSGDRWCLAKILTAGSWSPTITAPLAQPGMNLKVGDCIVSINGQALASNVDIQKPLEGTAGQAISLKIAPAGGGAERTVTVVPIPDEGALRNLDWIEGNRKRVGELSGGKLAYVYMPNTAGDGFTNFNRWYFAQTDKQGAIIDERFNGGGQIADYVIEVMSRKPQAYWQPRYGAIDRSPGGAIYGPKVMVVDETAGSGGDAMPWMFKYNKVGSVVGKRTWGGLVGIGGVPLLMDGGRVTSPGVAFFSPKGEWDVENHGVDPDYVVEQDPKLVAAGHDPQLEAAVSVALDQLAKTPPPVAPARPAFPKFRQPPR
jgi:tricorn protease